MRIYRDDNRSDLFVGHVDTGRPFGDKEFIKKLEKIAGRTLERKRPGPKREKN